MEQFLCVIPPLKTRWAGVIQRQAFFCSFLWHIWELNSQRVLCLNDVSVFTCNVQSDAKLKSLSAPPTPKKKELFFFCIFAWVQGEIGFRPESRRKDDAQIRFILGGSWTSLRIETLNIDWKQHLGPTVREFRLEFGT